MLVYETHLLVEVILIFVQSNFAKKMKSDSRSEMANFHWWVRGISFQYADYYIAYKLYANTHVVPLFSNKSIRTGPDDSSERVMSRLLLT